VYGQSGLHGPLIQRIHTYLLALGYPDEDFFRDLSAGFPSGGRAAPTGLWPTRVVQSLNPEPASVAQAFERAPALVCQWRTKRRPDRFADKLVERNLEEVRLGRREEVDIDKLKPGTYVAHPEFMVVQGDSFRACDDCSISGWNGTYANPEKVQLCSADDPVAYASALIEACPLASPCVSVADEEKAYRNYATRRPDAMIMLVFLRKCIRAWRDFALTFGDAAAVKAYNRVRRLITHFFLVEFAIACWAYYDDTAMVEPAATAHNAWFVFLKVHQLLSIPIKGNPLSHQGGPPVDEEKYRPPRGSNIFLGELLKVHSLPCSAETTQKRKAASRTLIGEVRARGFLHDSMASSLMGKIRCLGEGLHGRVGIPALQALAAFQHGGSNALFRTLCSSFDWLEDIMEHAGPRIWPYSALPQIQCIFWATQVNRRTLNRGSVPCLRGPVNRYGSLKPTSRKG
jgi:hypothetical protein